MKSRSEAARFIEAQLTAGEPCKLEKADKAHYGVQNLRELMDFIYGGEPKRPKDMIVYDCVGKKSSRI
ncbi:MAG: hypothetical protein ACJA1I_000519 [Zhongshania marina]|jgi:hypothetical protein